MLSPLTSTPPPPPIPRPTTPCSLGSGPDRLTVRDGLTVFMHQYISRHSLEAAAAARPASSWPRGTGAPTHDELKSRLKMAKKALESVVAGDVDEFVGGGAAGLKPQGRGGVVDDL
jgi:hypothetical protein